ncbi:uncharacterized protein BCR38DRAFT_423911 [Pseudomassariella vexata]|uniref:Uncharacterized protein n=1 Tax=Pseudomassariella vexata TaxID=1141098 RepID=A0A1Y2EAP5_9PEZI|nr:uncharacterized protein BCR38DRAFT_423911 [Pseudomassariella vexata]ORY68629.1 hypothetical protein BCR38DRAFT_423911 [Pseudomassariella vexata]
MGGLGLVMLKPEEYRHWDGRLSGVLPFMGCYMSSVPTAPKIWLVENRREVLGAYRMPLYQQYGSEHIFDSGLPPSRQGQRARLGTPAGDAFFHNPDGDSNN